MNRIVLIIFVLIFPIAAAAQEPSGDIINREFPDPAYNLPAPDTNEIDMGMCALGDSLKTNFIINNYWNYDIFVAKQQPSFEIARLDGYDGEFEKVYNDTSVNKWYGFSLTIEDSSTNTITVGYKPDAGSVPGKEYRVFVSIGLLASNTEPENYFLKKNYILRYRLTEKKLDGFEDFFLMDSVWVNPSEPYYWNWIVQNTSNEKITVNNYSTKMLTPFTSGKEEFITDYNGRLPFVYPSVSKNYKTEWPIGYKPVDLGVDSMELELEYREENTGTTDYASLVVAATGVEHRLEPIPNGTQGDIYRDTIGEFEDSVFIVDFGQVPRTQQVKRVSLQHFGNMPHKWDSIFVRNIENDEESEIFKINDRPAEVIFPGEASWFTVTFRIEEKGIYYARYIIYNDIQSRNIHGYPDKAKRTVIILKAEVAEAEILLVRDTVDFGNVVVTDSCGEQVLEIFPIKNTGRKVLNIDDWSVAAPFEIANTGGEMDVLPYETSSMTISCTRDENFWFNGLPEERFDSLVFKSNSGSDFTNIVHTVYLKARGVEPSFSDLYIPRDIKARPGREIIVPIIVSGEEVDIASEFRTKLIYNKTLLRFKSYETIGTASEGAIGSQVLAKEFEDSFDWGLNLSIRMTEQDNSNFKERDTLILLHFETFLGDSRETEISFLQPEFSDGMCYKILGLESGPGLFRLDSVIGLDWKIQQYNEQEAGIIGIYPNPAIEDVKVKFRTKNPDAAELNIINSFGGNCYKNIINKTHAGINEVSFDAASLMPGIYYIELKTGNKAYYEKFIITR